MTKAANFLLSREVCFVKPSEEVLYVLLYAHLDHLHSILECEFRRPRVGRTFGRGDPLSPFTIPIGHHLTDGCRTGAVPLSTLPNQTVPRLSSLSAGGITS